jgi:hypothetical protein
VPRHELAEGPHQQQFVDLLGPGDQFQQGVAERRGVAATECEQQVLQREPLPGIEAADRAEVEHGDAAIGDQQDVARVRVGMEHAALGNLVHHTAQQRTA